MNDADSHISQSGSLSISVEVFEDQQTYKFGKLITQCFSKAKFVQLHLWHLKFRTAMGLPTI